MAYSPPDEYPEKAKEVSILPLEQIVVVVENGKEPEFHLRDEKSVVDYFIKDGYKLKQINIFKDADSLIKYQKNNYGARSSGYKGLCDKSFFSEEAIASGEKFMRRVKNGTLRLRTLPEPAGPGD